MLLQLLARFQKLHVARTAAEREAIFRFRYAIYGRELKREYPGLDHARERFEQEEDRDAILFYTGSAQHVTGTCRARIFDEVPPEVAHEYSLERLPQRYRIAVLERLMVRPTLRGRALLPSILWHGYAELMSHGVELCVLTCVPGLARHYVKLGARPYGARMVEGASSTELPVMIVMNDWRYLERVGSFMAPQVRRLAHPFDAAPLSPLFEGRQAVTFEPRAVERELPPFFDGVDRTAVARGGFLFDVEAGELVVREGTAGRELFFVVDGEVAVNEITRIGKGEPFGEFVFLGVSDVRTATVRAVRRSRILALRRGFLEGLSRRDADAVRERLAAIAKARLIQRDNRVRRAP